MTDLEKQSSHPALETSQAECEAWTILSERGEYTHSELAFMFEVADSTVSRHVRGDCPHE